MSTHIIHLTDPAERRAEFGRLLDFGAASVPAGGGPFAYLDDIGKPDPTLGSPLWITARYTHVYGLAVLLGRPELERAVAAGVAALATNFADAEHGGWFAALDSTGRPQDGGRKAMYEHAFVVLAAATATAVGLGDGRRLLEQALTTVEQRFWDEPVGACRESFDRDWSSTEPYRGANSNTHTVEAFLAAGSVTGDALWTRRAARIAERIVHRDAAASGWRLPEHYDEFWQIDREYNRDRPNHRFRPYGVTVGHMLEWSRLLVHLDAALPGSDWFIDDARRLFDTALHIGWRADGQPGFVYTLDWHDAPVIAERMHWVAVEAAMAANALARRTKNPRYTAVEQRLWGFAATFIDTTGGGWHHELSPEGNPSTVVWTGKPDIYHAAQGVLLPDLPFSPSLVSSVQAASRPASTQVGS